MTALDKSDLISVIVPIYNTGTPLKRCVDSLLQQEYSPLEIILVDDGSIDKETLSLCEHFQHSYPNIRVIHQANGGASKARNTGIDNAKGRFIGFVDSDDRIDKDAYKNLYEMAVKHDASLVLGALEIEGGRQRSKSNKLSDGIHSAKEVISEFLLGSWHSACTNLYAKSLIGDTRFPQNEINEDYIFNFEILTKSDAVAILNKPFYHYIRTEGSVTSKPASMKHLDWLKHTNYVMKRTAELYDGELADEAAYQNLYANIILSNKCLLNIARGFKDEPSKLYSITTCNLRDQRNDVFNNPLLNLRLRVCGVLLSTVPGLYKNLILTLLKLKK